jgi:hypothetical protein
VLVLQRDVLHLNCSGNYWKCWAACRASPKIRVSKCNMRGNCMHNAHQLLVLCVINTVMFQAVHAFVASAAIARSNGARFATALALSSRAKPPPHDTVRSAQ